MNKNRNQLNRYKRNKYNKKSTDMSNNEIILLSNRDFNINRNFKLLESSNSTNLLKLFLDISINNIFQKNNINNSFESYHMTSNNKLIKFLDDTINTDRENDNNLKLDLFIKEKNEEFLSTYNSPFFSGSSGIIPITNEDTEKTIANIIKEEILIEASIDNLLDLINLCDKYPLVENIEYNINMTALHNIKPSLVELQNMIGMSSIKENIVDQILYFIQDLHNTSDNNGDYMHAVIYGPPGTGKTEVAKIMGKIFSNLGILKNNVFKKVTRDDLVAGYLGQTSLKTKDVIKECLGGVLFIDEAYALGNKEKKDSFSKESIDTICEALSNHKSELMCIIAGYEQELKDCFFSYNPGLESRFTWKFNIDKYTSLELKQIFEKKISDNKWSLKEDLDNEWFEKHIECFSFFGRDMETLFSKVKIAHSRRVFCLPKEEKTKISMKDLEKGFEIYKKMGDSENREKEKERVNYLYNTLYC
jgi:AAA+ superfamily predicted ATPase